MGSPARVAAAAAAGLVVFAFVAATLSRRGGSVSTSMATSPWGKSVSKERVAKMLLEGTVSEEIVCESADFAYCGDATCEVLTNSSAACGCRIYRGRDAKFKLNWESALLVESSAFRYAVVAAADGDSDKAKTLICDAMADGSLYRTTFGASRGSVSLDVEKRRSLRSETKASCMGAPCDFDSNWNATTECDATCICAIDATASLEDTCLRNGVEQAYWDSYGGLLGVIGEIGAAFNARGDIDKAVTRDADCRSDCTVHHEGHRQ